MILSLFNSFTVPIEISYKPAFLLSPLVKRMNNFIDLIFFIDILMAFRTIYIDD